MLPQRPLESHIDTMDTPLGTCPTCINITHHACCGRKQLGITPLEIQRWKGSTPDMFRVPFLFESLASSTCQLYPESDFPSGMRQQPAAKGREQLSYSYHVKEETDFCPVLLKTRENFP